MGAWIETDDTLFVGEDYEVAPLVGAWIETFAFWRSLAFFLSHPSWVRGLKRKTHSMPNWMKSRTPRGCVD